MYVYKCIHKVHRIISIVRGTCDKYATLFLSFCAAMGADFSIYPTIFPVHPNYTAEIIATFRVDNIAQEINETAQLKITVTLGTFPPEAIFIDTIEFVIVDSDGKIIYIHACMPCFYRTIAIESDCHHATGLVPITVQLHVLRNMLL